MWSLKARQQYVCDPEGLFKYFGLGVLGYSLFIDTARVLKSSILFKIKRENVIYLANSVM